MIEAEEFLMKFCSDILEMDSSIRFVALADRLGEIAAFTHREDVSDMLTAEEMEHYAIQAVISAIMLENFKEKIGEIKYNMAVHRKQANIIIPIDSANRRFYTLLSFELDSDANCVVEAEVLPYIEENKKHFFER